jgi:hypothetical protein
MFIGHSFENKKMNRRDAESAERIKVRTRQKKQDFYNFVVPQAAWIIPIFSL